MIAATGLLSLGQAIREMLALRRLVNAADDSDLFARAIDGLPSPHRRIVGTFVDDLRSSSTDDALTRALVRAAKTAFTTTTWVHILSTVATIAAIAAPMVVTLLDTAGRVFRLFVEGRTQTARERYLNGADSLHPAFETLSTTFDDTAIIMGAIAIAWAFRWWGAGCLHH
ncbi:MAG: hypothetical protein AAFV29_17750 [Myxococcota bacterium]